MEYVAAKTIVTRNKNNFWFGNDYNMNIYRGCCHGCIYCDSRSECYRVDNFDTVRAKKDALKLIRNDLQSKAKRGVIGTGAMSDPYNPFEAELKLSRHAFELINAFEFGATVVTKSDLITRDIDVLSEIKAHSPVLAKLTITTADDTLCKRIEPRVCESSKRFAALKQLAQADIPCGVVLMPLLPFINDTEENVQAIVRMAHENGASFIYPYFGVTLRANQREYFFQQLDAFFPGYTNQYCKQFGDRYECTSPHFHKLNTLFQAECKRYRLLYKMPDIISFYKKGYEDPQIKWF